MTKRPLILHPAVEDDLLAIYEHYAQFDPVLPGRFQARMDEQLERLEVFPESGAFLFESYRRVLIKRFPYLIAYVVRERRVDVLAVIGVRRDPAWIEATLEGRAES